MDAIVAIAKIHDNEYKFWISKVKEMIFDSKELPAPTVILLLSIIGNVYHIEKKLITANNWFLDFVFNFQRN